MAATLTQIGPKQIGQVYKEVNRRFFSTAGKTIKDLLKFLTRNPFVNLFKVNDKIFSLPVVKGTEGETAIDVSELRSKATGYAMAYDSKGLGSTSYPSAVTFIDGEQKGEGILNYRGYNIKDLTQKASFTEVAYLLFNDKLPNAEELKRFEAEVINGMRLEPKIIEMITQLPSTVHPMNILSGAIAALEGFVEENDRKDYSKNYALLIGKVLAVTAFLNRKVHLQNEFPNFVSGRDVVDNFMDIMFGNDVFKDPELYQIKKRAIDKLLILHADHEQNCSTFTGRVVASGGAGPFAAVSAAINALYGPAHGGANQAALEQLEAIDRLDKPSVDEKIEEFMKTFDDKAALKKLTGYDMLMGFGHRVYKTRDPRASVIEDTCKELFANNSFKATLDPGTQKLLELAQKLEHKALNEEYFKKRNLYPNVDFYSGIVYKALGLSTEMFTPLFAAGRTPGWLTHMQEQVKDCKNIIRPRQIYLGKTLSDREALPADKKPGVALVA